MEFWRYCELRFRFKGTCLIPLYRFLGLVFNLLIGGGGHLRPNNEYRRQQLSITKSVIPIVHVRLL